ncbi:hypothetical protein FGB62_182g130 [Gracilaria domingensis]|nr:hypothetical protein FGB62_182g130 [Gracilaria domingensis]
MRVKSTKSSTLRMSGTLLRLGLASGVEPHLLKSENLRPGTLTLSGTWQGGDDVKRKAVEVWRRYDMGKIGIIGGVVLQLFHDVVVVDADGKVQDAQTVVGGKLLQTGGAGQLNEVLDVEQHTEMPHLQGQDDGVLAEETVAETGTGRGAVTVARLDDEEDVVEVLLRDGVGAHLAQERLREGHVGAGGSGCAGGGGERDTGGTRGVLVRWREEVSAAQKRASR